MSLHREFNLEDQICADLTAAGWLYDAADAGRCGRNQAPFVDASHPASLDEDRLRQQNPLL